MTTTMLRVLRTQRGAGGGSVVLLGAVATTAALNYGLGLALAWLLPTDGFGAVGVLLNLLLLATSVLAAGFPWALARATARGAGAGPDPAAVRSALVGNVVLGTVLAGALAAVQLTTGAVLPGVGPVPTLLAAATIVVLAVVAVLVGALQGARRFDGVGVARVTEIVVKVLAALGAVGLAGHGVGGVAAALLAAAVASALVAFAAAADRLRPSRPRPRPARGARSGVVAAAVPMAVSTTGFGLLGTLDVLALGAAGVPLAVVGVYQAAAVLARAPFFVGSALSDAAFPFIAAAPTAAAARHALLGALRWVPLVLVPGQLVLLVAPGPVLDVVLPGAYAGAAGPVRVLTLGTTGLLLADMLLKALFARGHAVAVARRVPVAVAAQVAALLLLVPAHGALGAAWAFTVGTWTTVALLGAVGLRGLRPTVPTPGAVRWGGAVAVLVVVLVLAADLPTPAALAVVGAGLLAYALLVLPLLLVPHRPAPVTRATTPTEVTR